MDVVPFASVALFVAFFAILFAPVVGLGFWTRWLGRRSSVPRFAYRTSYGLVALAALAIAFGVIFGVVVGHGAVSGEGIDPSQKARALAEGISEAMNWSAFGLLIALVAALWLGFCTWRWRQGSR